MRRSRPLHILMTADAVGGVWQYATGLCAEMSRAGHRVTLAVFGPEASDEQRRQAAGITRCEVLETGLPLDWLVDDPAAVEHAAAKLSELANTLGADLVHCNSPALAGAARYPVPVVATAHGCVATWWDALNSDPLPKAFEWHARLMRSGLRAADVVVAPSVSFARTVRRRYALPHLPLAVHNGRAPVTASASGPQIDAAMTVGRLWDQAKNAAVLDRAAARLNVPFLAAGALRGPHGEEFVPAHLHALGHQSEAALAKWLALGPVFVSAARFEPFGLAVLEAASAGCALVLADIATFRELWDGAALFVKSDDDEGFAQAIEGLIQNPDLRRARGQAARERSLAYSPAATASAMSDIYQAALVGREVAA